MSWHAIPLTLQILLIAALLSLWDRHGDFPATLRNGVLMIQFFGLSWLVWLIAAILK